MAVTVGAVLIKRHCDVCYPRIVDVSLTLGADQPSMRFAPRSRSVYKLHYKAAHETMCGSCGIRYCG